MKLVRLQDMMPVASEIRFADSWWSRCRGMIGRSFADSPFDALVFDRCRAVHCCWMSEAIDVLFLSGTLEVLGCCPSLRPWRLASGGKNCRITVELPAGKIEECGIRSGDRLMWKE